MIVQRTPLNEFKKHESSAQIWIYFQLSPIRTESNIYKHSLKYFKRVSSAEGFAMSFNFTRPINVWLVITIDRLEQRESPRRSVKIYDEELSNCQVHSSSPRWHLK